jgi:hypothetical protein
MKKTNLINNNDIQSSKTVNKIEDEFKLKILNSKKIDKSIIKNCKPKINILTDNNNNNKK